MYFTWFSVYIINMQELLYFNNIIFIIVITEYLFNYTVGQLLGFKCLIYIITGKSRRNE